MIIILSQDSTLYSTRVLSKAFTEVHQVPVQILNVLSLEVKIGKGVFSQGKRLTPSLVIPRFTGHLTLAGLAVLKEWEREGINVLNSSQGIALANDQLATLQALVQHDLPIPDTSFCSQPNGTTYDSLTEGGAKIIKLLTSNKGKGVTIAPNAQVAHSLLSTLSSLHSSGITQTFHPETNGEDYRLLILDGKLLRAIKRTAKEGEFRANLHQGGTATPFTPLASDLELALKATQAVSLRFAGVDLIHTDEGTKILEVNASPGLEGIELKNEGIIAHQIATLVSH